MKLEFCEPTGQRATYGIQPSAGEPIIRMDHTEVSDRSGMTGGPTMVKLQVEGPDGRFAIVWVSARINPRGQVQFELATNKREQTVRTHVTANWRI